MDKDYIINILKQTLGLWDDWEVDGVYVFKNNLIKVQFIEPHKGIDYKYMIRADLNVTFDRWSVSRYQETFESNKEFINIIKDLIDMMDLDPKIELLSEYFEIGNTYEVYCEEGCYSVINDGGSKTIPKYCPYCGKELMKDRIDLIYKES